LTKRNLGRRVHLPGLHIPHPGGRHEQHHLYRRSGRHRHRDPQLPGTAL